MGRVHHLPQELISIHALREEGDRRIDRHDKALEEFLSTPSARRATVPLCAGGKAAKKFLSTPSARRATFRGSIPPTGRADFYPRPPRGGRRFFPKRAASSSTISIHALREEGDSNSEVGMGSVSVFLSTPSARRATVATQMDMLGNVEISIHALREEGDSKNRDKISIFL